jgi:hypothetical protein
MARIKDMIQDENEAAMSVGVQSVVDSGAADGVAA